MKDSYLRICKKVASFSDHHSHKMAALVTKGNKILSTGFNKMKTHPLSPHPFKSCHAEFMAIKLLDEKALKGSTIFIYRQNKLGILANSRPCPSCMQLIIDSGIKKIVYTHETGIKVEYVAA